MTSPAHRWGPWIARPSHKPGRKRRIAFATGISLALQLALIMVFTWVPRRAAPPQEAEVINVSIVTAPSPAPAPSPPAPAKTAPKPTPKVPTPKAKARPTPARAEPSPIAARVPEPAPPADELSDAQLAAATTAGSGSASGAGGRPCNMVAWLQGELRRDSSVRNAMDAAHRGRPTLVWNGVWIRSPGEEGEGLAVVRQAVMVHVAFAPDACRADPVRGLVVLSLDDAPGAPRIAMGEGQWRWTDLLH